MKKTILCFFASATMICSSTAFAQDTVKHSVKASKAATKKVTTHHKVVKKTTPAM